MDIIVVEMSEVEVIVTELGDIVAIQQLSSEVYIDYSIEMNDREIVLLHNASHNATESTKDRISRLYFAMRVSVSEIAETTGHGHLQVAKMLKESRESVLKSIKQDLRANKKILGHMISLMVQIDNQVRVMWDKYNQLEADASVLREGLMEAYEIKKADPKAKVGKLSELTEASKAVLAIHDRQQGYLTLLNRQTLSMLTIWEKFGLTGENAFNLIVSGGVDVEVKIQEIRQTVFRVVDAVKEEVTNQDEKQRLFSRLAKEMDKIGMIQSKEKVLIGNGVMNEF